LPLQDPFLAPTVAIAARIGATASADEVFIIDSGASISVLRENLSQRLQLPLHGDTRVSVVDVTGQARDFHGAILPELWLGRVAVHNLTAATMGYQNILGHDVLGQLAWEIDLDRGVLQLDAPPWAEGDGPIRRVALVSARREPLAGYDVHSLISYDGE